MFIIVERMLKVFRLIIENVHIIDRARNLSNKWMKVAFAGYSPFFHDKSEQLG